VSFIDSPEVLAKLATPIQSLRLISFLPDGRQREGRLTGPQVAAIVSLGGYYGKTGQSGRLVYVKEANFSESAMTNQPKWFRDLVKSKGIRACR